MHLRVLLIWPPAGSVHGPPLGLAAVAGYLRQELPETKIRLEDLNVAVLTEALKVLPESSVLHRTLRSKWTQADVVQDALSRWALGDDAPLGIGALPDWECHYLGLLFGRVLDGFVEGMTEAPDLIGLSVCDNGFIASIGLTRRLRKRFPRARIVWGGVSMSELQAPAVLEAIPEVDAVVAGEGEKALLALVKALPILPEEPVDGVCTRSQTGRTTRRTYLVAEPAFDLFDLTIYPALELPMSIGRGCAWGRCSFCNENFATSEFQPTDPAAAAQDALSWQERYRPVSFDLVDSAANSNRQNFRNFVDTLAAGGGLREWRCMMRTAGIRKDDLEAAVQAGLRTVYFGIESLDDEVLRLMNKGETVAQHLRAIRMALELGLRVEGDLILFYPSDTPAAVERTVEVLQRYDHLFSRVDLSFSRFVPCIRSPIWNEAEKYGIRLMNLSLRLARHLSPEISEVLVPWDPMWAFIDRPPSEVEDLCEHYLRLQAAVEKVRRSEAITRSWYTLGESIVLEMYGHKDNALDRIFLEGPQRELWVDLPDIESGNVSTQTFMKRLQSLGFIVPGKQCWERVAFEQGMQQKLRNCASRPGPSELNNGLLGRLRID